MLKEKKPVRGRFHIGLFVFSLFDLRRVLNMRLVTVDEVLLGQEGRPIIYTRTFSHPYWNPRHQYPNGSYRECSVVNTQQRR